MATQPRVGLFVTCLVNTIRPNIAMALAQLLEATGHRVEVPFAQTCCGQPGYNAGDWDAARALAKQTITAFEPYDYLIAPSGSCLATIRHDYPELLKDDPEWRERAQRLAAKSWEALSYFAQQVPLEQLPRVRFPYRVTYHDSCSGLRSLGIKGQPRQLLARIEGLTLVEMAEAEVCCGFGGTFCVKYPELSEAMVERKVQNILKSGAQVLLGGDLGCLMNIAGRLARIHAPVRVYHTLEVVAGLATGPGLVG
ncbi:(Fe-S)-binding protein [Hydrogenophilus thiooxidans]|uniref:(Fe-S)-binding protein n=1 Tax=Hydrogenophilus thiooxidans TaxID=2820326 RepID=UPI001C211A1D|nr:(Fe-S)-binding protein [Hydrogenophilus thiooxidans]